MRHEESRKSKSKPLPDFLQHERVLSLQQYAELKDLSIATVRRQCKAGKLPVIQLSDRRLGVRVRDAIS